MTPATPIAQRARCIDFEEAKETESWKRGVGGASNVEIKTDVEGLGQQIVLLPDGDEGHRTLLVRSPDGEYVGACDCDGDTYHDTACAHLCVLRALEGIDAFDVETSGTFVEELKSAGSDPENGENDTAEEIETADVVDTPDEQAAPTTRRKDAFAEPLPDVDEQYVMELGGETYIRRAGYARLGHEAGLRPVPEIVQYAHEGENGRAVVLGKVLNSDGEIVAQDIGTAGPPEYEDMDGAEANLDELAVTRAISRAMAWATGEGLTAVEEIPGGPDA